MHPCSDIKLANSFKVIPSELLLSDNSSRSIFFTSAAFNSLKESFFFNKISWISFNVKEPGVFVYIHSTTAIIIFPFSVIPIAVRACFSESGSFSLIIPSIIKNGIPIIAEVDLSNK